jgi:hypothetical protein
MVHDQFDRAAIEAAKAVLNAPLRKGGTGRTVLDEVVNIRAIQAADQTTVAVVHPVFVPQTTSMEDSAPAPQMRYVHANGLVHGVFTTVFDQLSKAWEWNKDRRWGYTFDAFVDALNDAPEWPSEPDTALVLVPYLMGGASGNTPVVQTFHELWRVASDQYRRTVRRPHLGNLSGRNFRLSRGIKHESGLTWEKIHLSALCSCSPLHARSTNHVPHAAVLAAAALHPAWFKTHSFGFWMSGYELDVLQNRSWRGVPRIRYRRDNECLTLGFGLEDMVDPEFVAPVLR